MTQFFKVYTYTPWEKLSGMNLVKVRLMLILEIFKKYPIIEGSFFEDLKLNIQKHPHYINIQSIRRIIGPKSEDYSIQNWNLIWAMDYKNRIYQFLFQKIKNNSEIQGILVALAPPELAQLFSKHKKACF